VKIARLLWTGTSSVGRRARYHLTPPFRGHDDVITSAIDTAFVREVALFGAGPREGLISQDTDPHGLYVCAGETDLNAPLVALGYRVTERRADA
jgi:hypothetical protein